MNRRCSGLRATMVATTAALLWSAPLMAQDTPAPYERSKFKQEREYLPTKDKAGNQLEYLVYQGEPDAGSREAEECMPGTYLCFSLVQKGEPEIPQLRIRNNKDQSSVALLSLDVPVRRTDAIGPVLARETIELWDTAIRRVVTDERDSHGESMIIGVITSYKQRNTNGDEAESKLLWLYEIVNAGSSEPVFARQILSVPFGAMKSNNACFNDEDIKMRLGECQDQLAVFASLTMDTENQGPKPQLKYEIVTGTQPGDLPLRKADQPKRQMTQSELGKREYPACSYKRNLVWNPATLRYEFDQPAPECAIFGLKRQ